MEHSSPSVRPPWIREPDAMYTPCVAKAQGAAFRGFALRDPAIFPEHDPMRLEGAALCAMQDQILWLTSKVVHAERLYELQSQQMKSLNDRFDNLSKQIEIIKELQNREFSTLSSMVTNLNNVVGDMLAGKAKRALITQSGVEAAMSGRAKPKRKRR